MPQSQAGLSLSDLGLLQSVNVVERMRTANGQLIEFDAHLARFYSGCKALGIELPSRWSMKELSAECLDKHFAATDEKELAVIWMATPGCAGKPTLLIYAQPLPWRKIWQLTRDGETLVVSDSRNVPAECWPPQVKTRSRLQYYLADQQARRQVPDGVASGLLPDTHGHLTETSSANILLFLEGRLISPPSETILNGVSLRRTTSLAESLRVPFCEEPITIDMALQGDELLLTGTTACLWFASRLEHKGQSREFYSREESSLFQRLKKAWCEDLGLNYVKQAKDNEACGEPPRS